MLPYITILRPVNCLMAALAVYVASLIAGQPFVPSLSVIYALISVFLICAGGMVINDYFDVEIDRVNKPARPIPAGKISAHSALVFSCLLFAVGLFTSYMINIFTLLVAIAASALLVLYAWKLKKVILVGHLSVSSLVALTFIYGGLVNLNYKPTLSLAILALLANTGREIYKSIEDVLGDEKAGLQTLPIKYGVTQAKIVASLFVICAIILSFLPYFLGIFKETYLFFVVIADIMFLGAVVSPVKFSSKLCKIAMFVSLLAFFAGSIV